MTENITPQQYEVLKLRTGQEIVGMTRNTTTGVHITLPMMCHLTVQSPRKDTLATFYPYAPMSQDATIVIPNNMIAHRNKMNEQFIPFYDSASAEWMQMLDEGKVPLINNLSTSNESRPIGFKQHMDRVVQAMIEDAIDNPMSDDEMAKMEQEMMDEEFESSYKEFANLPAPIDKKKLH
jgi:hypothetical protein